MLKDSLNKKTYIGDIEPNPKEFGIWIKEDGSASIYDYIKNEWKGSSSNNDGEEASSIEYLDVSGLDEKNKIRLGMYSIVAKISLQGVSYIVHSSEPIYGVGKEYLTHVAIDFTVKLYDSVVNSSNPKIVTLKELFLELGSTPITQEQLDAIPRLTKEQFYSLES